MTLVQDASTPTPVTGTAATSIVSGSFSPPANALLVALVSSGWGSTAPTINITDSTAVAWTKKVEITGTGTNKGKVAIWERQLVAAPGAMTVTATYTGVNPQGSLLCPIVLTGAATDQSTAAIASRAATSNTVATIAITVSQTGSFIYGISDDPDTASVFTANGITTQQYDYNDTTDGLRINQWRSTNLTSATGSQTYGGSYAAANNPVIAAIEIIPGAGGAAPVNTTDFLRFFK